TLSNGRLLLAVPLALALWFTFVRPVLSPWWPIAAGVAFAALAIVHARALERAVGRHGPRRRAFHRRSSLRARSRSLRPRVAFRAAEHGPDRSGRGDARRVDQRGGTDRCGC